MYFNESERDYSRYNDDYNREYGQHRDSVADWQNELNRADSEYWNQKQFGYGQYSDEKNLSYQQHINDRDFDEAVRQFEEQMKASKSSSSGSGSGSGSGNANLQHVASLSSADLVSTLQAYNTNEDNKGLEDFLNDCVAVGRLTEEQADKYYLKYGVGLEVANPPKTSSTSYYVRGGGAGVRAQTMVDMMN
jgi:hypothetical protein